MQKTKESSKEVSTKPTVIKEIRKLGKDIKEIKPVKVENLEEEIYEEEDSQFSNFISGKPDRDTSPTLEQSEIVNNDTRERRIPKEDEKEINFRPSYLGGGGNAYQSTQYTPVGSAESARALGERSLEQRGGLQQGQNQNSNSNNNQSRPAGHMETSGERTYLDPQQQNQDQNDRRRKNDF